MARAGPRHSVSRKHFLKVNADTDVLEEEAKKAGKTEERYSLSDLKQGDPPISKEGKHESVVCWL